MKLPPLNSAFPRSRSLSSKSFASYVPRAEGTAIDSVVERGGAVLATIEDGVCHKELAASLAGCFLGSVRAESQNKCKIARNVFV